MKQETTNTFDKGLNKDLNPIVTPNNVLTDCLNGTFITFNGDELVLQNDAGNTKIPTKWDKKMLLDYSKGSSYNKNVIVKLEDGILYRSLTDSNAKPIFNKDGSLNKIYWELFDPSVKLSDGFYPIGIKEYGGVLYIVSGKKGSPIDPETGEHSDLENIDMVEFGSYPSPKHANHKIHSISQEDAIIISSKEELYKPRVINETFFKTGGYVVFNYNSIGDMDIEVLLTPKNVGIYKVKLLHQLSSGMYDLTSDVWIKYNEHKEDLEAKFPNNPLPEHWIFSGEHTNPFKYYCPTQYKGKLSISVELNEPLEFKFSSLPKVAIVNGEHRLSYEIRTTGSSAMKFSEESPYEIWISEDNKKFKEVIEKTAITEVDSGEIDVNGEPIKMQLINRYVVYNGESKMLSYQFRPKIISHSENIEDPQGVVEKIDFYYDWDAFPKEFQDKFTLSGTKLLEKSLESISYKPQQKNEEHATYEVLVLINEFGEVGVNMTPLEPNGTPFVFLLDDPNITTLTTELGYHVLGTYKKGTNNLASLNLNSINDDIFDLLLSDTMGEKAALKELIKKRVNDTIITEFVITGDLGTAIEFNMPFESLNTDGTSHLNLAFSQGPKTRGGSNVPYTSNGGRIFYLNIDAEQDLDITTEYGSWTLKKQSYVNDPEHVYKYAILTEFSPIEKYYRHLPDSEEFFSTAFPKALHGTLFEENYRNIKYEVDKLWTHSEKVDIYIADRRLSGNRTGLLANVTKPQWTTNGKFVGDDISNSYENLRNTKSIEYVRYGDDTLGYIILAKKTQFILHDTYDGRDDGYNDWN